MNTKKNKPKPSRGSKKRSRFPRKKVETDENGIGFEGKVVDTLPGTRFKVLVERAKGLEPMYINCQVKTFFKLRNIKIMKGSTVRVLVDLQQGINPEDNSISGVIVERLA